MTPDIIFQLCNQLVLIGWIVLIFTPHLHWPIRLVWGLAIPSLAVLYTTLILLYWGKTPGGFSSLQLVSQLFQSPWLLLAGWIHYLTFDLFIGCWEVKDAQEQGIPHWLVIPCLILTFLFGPIGWLSYFLLRTIKTKSLKLWT